VPRAPRISDNSFICKLLQGFKEITAWDLSGTYWAFKAIMGKKREVGELISHSAEKQKADQFEFELVSFATRARCWQEDIYMPV
jgi:hypothetical protein